MNPFSLASHSGIVNVPSSLRSHCDLGTHSVRDPSKMRQARSVSAFSSAATSISSGLGILLSEGAKWLNLRFDCEVSLARVDPELAFGVRATHSDF